MLILKNILVSFMSGGDIISLESKKHKCTVLFFMEVDYISHFDYWGDYLSQNIHKKIISGFSFGDILFEYFCKGNS